MRRYIDADDFLLPARPFELGLAITGVPPEGFID